MEAKGADLRRDFSRVWLEDVRPYPSVAGIKRTAQIAAEIS